MKECGKMTDKKEQKEGQKEMPIAKFRRGNVEAAVWRKTYKDKDGEERGFYSMSTSMSFFHLANLSWEFLRRF